MQGGLGACVVKSLSKILDDNLSGHESKTTITLNVKEAIAFIL